MCTFISIYQNIYIFTLSFPTAYTKQCKKLCKAPEMHNNSFLAHFICSVNVSLGTSKCTDTVTRPWLWVWVRVRAHGCGYGYRYETMGTGKGPTCQRVMGMGTGTGSRPWVRVWVHNVVPGCGYGYVCGYGYYKSASQPKFSFKF